MGLSRVLIILGVFCAVLGIGSALKCYVCAGSDSSDCAAGKVSSMSVQSCTNLSTPSLKYNHNSVDDDENEAPKFKSVCLQFFGTAYKPKLFAKGCGIVPAKADPCKFLSKYVPIEGCKYCKTDLCNKGYESSEEEVY